MATSPTGRPEAVPPGTGTDWFTVPCESGHCAKLRFNADGSVDIGSTRHDQVLTFDAGEWTAFVDHAVSLS